MENKNFLILTIVPKAPTIRIVLPYLLKGWNVTIKNIQRDPFLRETGLEIGKVMVEEDEIKK